MTGALLALAIAAAQAGGVVRSTDAAGRRTPADSVLVRGGVRDTTLAIVATSAGSALRADAVAAALGGVLRVARLGQWTIELAGVLFDLEEGVPFAGSRGAVYPLAGPPLVRDGALLIPLQLVADLAPRAGGNLTWDAGRRELRLGRGNPGVVTASAAARAASTTSPPAGAGTAPVAPPRAAKRYTVVVDAGHGGPDPGMRGPIGGSFTIYEKDVTLAVAKQLARALETRGVDVVMTRTTDTLIALSDRGRIANERRGDLFISVHVNAAPRSWKSTTASAGIPSAPAPRCANGSPNSPLSAWSASTSNTSARTRRICWKRRSECCAGRKPKPTADSQQPTARSTRRATGDGRPVTGNR